MKVEDDVNSLSDSKEEMSFFDCEGHCLEVTLIALNYPLDNLNLFVDFRNEVALDLFNG